jgi:hypothetical protein
MRRFIVLLLLGLGTAATAAVASAVPAGSNGGGRGGGDGRYSRGGGYFAIACGFSHRNQDDPIVFFRQPGRSHDHTFFGNTSTSANSTPASLRAAGETTCRLDEDTAAYWAPTLFVGGNAVRPRGAIAYYLRRTIEPVQAFPANLKVVAGNAAARSAQSTRVTFWTCGGRTISSDIPTCARSNLRLQVNFPNCWNGRQLDSADHRSHLAYSNDGVCPASHPVEVPTLTLVVYYGVAGGSQAELSSGGDFSGHADFVNAWDQDTLVRLVDRYLNRSRGRR